MRIAWLVPDFPLDRAESQYSFLRREANELLAAGGVELLVITFERTAAVAPGGASGVPYRVVNLTAPTDLGGKSQALSWAARNSRYGIQLVGRRLDNWYPLAWRSSAAHQQLEAFAPDVIHSHFMVPHGTAGVGLGRRLGVPVVSSVRGVDLVVDAGLNYGYRLCPAYDRRLRQALDACRIVLCATPDMRQLAIVAGGVANKTRLLPNSFAAPKQSPASSESQYDDYRPFALSVGNLFELKGFDRGIRALPGLPKELSYVIVGDGPERPHLMELARRLGVEARVHLVGSVAPDEVMGWMSAAEVYWFLSRREAFGNVLLEALWAGSPIVATSLGVAPQVLGGDSGSTVLADPDSDTELAAATIELMGGDRVDVGRRRSLLERFDPTRRSEELLRIYSAVLSE